MPYCPKCGNHYYAGTRCCYTCGQLLALQAENTGNTGNRKVEPKTVRHQERDKPCPYCHGTGKVDGPIGGEIMVTCPVCQGRRYNLIPEEWLKCSECGATGEFTYGTGIAYTRKPCPECKGTGWVET